MNTRGDPLEPERPRVALDVGPVRREPAGVGTYAALLAVALAHRARGSVALIGMRPGAADALAAVPRATVRRPMRGGAYHAWLQFHADRDALNTGAALVHYTNAAAPVVGRVPFVLTVHDLSLVRMPATHPAFRRLLVPLNLLSIYRAQAIIVPSHVTARELWRIGFRRKRIVVIPYAPTSSAADGALDTGDPSRILQELALERDQYIMHVATLEPRKNVERLVEAFENLEFDYPRLRLVLAGAPGWHFAPISERIASSSAKARILMTGYLPTSDINALIRGSALAAYVSLYEGFGMPVVDSLSLGAIVVTSRRTAMAEAAHGRALLVDPRDVDDITRGLRAALEQRDRLRQLILEHPIARTWDDVAAEHLDLYSFALRHG